MEVVLLDLYVVREDKAGVEGGLVRRGRELHTVEKEIHAWRTRGLSGKEEDTWVRRVLGDNDIARLRDLAMVVLGSTTKN